MSIKAMNWAMEQATGDPRAQCLLYVIADCATEEGIAWPGADWMAQKSQQSRATVYRRLDALQAAGLLVMFPRWIDDQGKVWNAAATGRRRTSPEIRLQFGVIVKQSAAPDDGPDDQETPAPQSQPETGVSQPETGPSHHVRQGSSHSGDDNHHSNQEEKSPLPPSGGTSEDADGFEDFQTDFAAPFQRPSIVRQLWRALKPDEKELVCKAARGYFAWQKLQKKPPALVSAQTFIRERDGWAQWLRWAPGAVQTTASYAADSREAKAIEALYATGRARPFYLSNGQLSYTGTITPQLLAFADAPERADWLWIEDRNQIGAWAAFLQLHVRGARAELVQAKGDQRRGIYAPWPWPPRKDGTRSTAPPGDELLSEEDQQDARDGLIR